MTEYLLAQYKQTELDLHERQDNQRHEWRTLHKVDRLELALRRARRRLRAAPAA